MLPELVFLTLLLLLGAGLPLLCFALTHSSMTVASAALLEYSVLLSHLVLLENELVTWVLQTHEMLNPGHQ